MWKKRRNGLRRIRKLLRYLGGQVGCVRAGCLNNASTYVSVYLLKYLHYVPLHVFATPEGLVSATSKKS